jgi:hypothetical protein
VTEQEKLTVPENPTAGVTVIVALAPEPGEVTVRDAGAEDALKGATTAKARVFEAICPNSTLMFELPTLAVRLAGTVAVS